MPNQRAIPAELHSLIASQSLFQSLEKESIEQLMQQGSICIYQPGEHLIEENQNNTCLFLILKGSANALMNNTLAGKLETGEFAGEISMAGISPPVASVVAESNVEAAVFPLAVIHRIAETDEQFANRLRDAGFHRISG